MKKHLALAKHHAKNILTSSVTGPNKKANKKLRAEHYLENMNHFMVSLMLAGMVGLYAFLGTRSMIMTAEAATYKKEVALTPRTQVSRMVPNMVSGEPRLSQTGAVRRSATGAMMSERTFSSAPQKQSIKKVPVRKKIAPVKRTTNPTKKVVSGERK